MKRITRIAGVVLSAALTGFLHSTAWSADASLPQTVIPGQGALEWDVTNAGGTNSGEAFIGTCDGSAGMTIDDAVSASGAGDAFDTAWQVYIDGNIFIAPDPVDLTDNIITAGPVMVGIPDLIVTVEYLFSDTVQAARIRAIFENTSGNPIDIRVEVPVNFASDAATLIEATSSGDLNFDINDRWLVTSDGGPNGPVNSTVLYGVDNPPEVPVAVTMTVCESAGTEGAGVTFDVTIPANTTRSLMFFAGLGDIEGLDNTIAGAIANVRMFNDPDTIDDSLVGDLSNAEWDETLNWRYIRAGIGIGGGSGGGGSCSLHTNSSIDPLFPLLLAGIAFQLLIRRRRRQRDWNRPPS